MAFSPADEVVVAELLGNQNSTTAPAHLVQREYLSISDSNASNPASGEITFNTLGTAAMTNWVQWSDGFVRFRYRIETTQSNNQPPDQKEDPPGAGNPGQCFSRVKPNLGASPYDVGLKAAGVVSLLDRVNVTLGDTVLTNNHALQSLASFSRLMTEYSTARLDRLQGLLGSSVPTTPSAASVYFRHQDGLISLNNVINRHCGVFVADPALNVPNLGNFWQTAYQALRRGDPALDNQTWQNFVNTFTPSGNTLSQFVGYLAASLAINPVIPQQPNSYKPIPLLGQNAPVTLSAEHDMCNYGLRKRAEWLSNGCLQHYNLSDNFDQSKNQFPRAYNNNTWRLKDDNKLNNTNYGHPTATTYDTTPIGQVLKKTFNCYVCLPLALCHDVFRAMDRPVFGGRMLIQLLMNQVGGMNPYKGLAPSMGQ